MVAQIDRHYIRTRPIKLWSRLLSYTMFEGRPLTTKGQWVNPVIFAHFALEKRLPQLKKVKAPVFILGTGRSGTTILGIVLSMHKDVGFLNEPKAMWHSLRQDEDLIGSYSRGPARYRLTPADATPAVTRAAHRLYGAYLRMTLSNRVVDKYPELIFRVPFVKALFPDARFLFLSRDGWDTCSSINSWSERLGQDSGGERHDWWGVNGRKWQLLVDQIIPEHADLAEHRDALLALEDHRIMAAVEWIVTMREGLSLVQDHPENVLHVPYNDLCENPDTSSASIAKFCELAEDARYQQYATEVLTSPRPYPPFELPDFLVAPFENTQKLLGHET